jgi:hypothetical protein
MALQHPTPIEAAVGMCAAAVVKTNTGTGSCRSLCTGLDPKNSGSRYGACVAAVDTGSGNDVGCAVARKAGAANQACYCADQREWKGTCGHHYVHIFHSNASILGCPAF